jgi:hypothetical protein
MADTGPADNNTFFYGNENADHHLEADYKKKSCCGVYS